MGMSNDTLWDYFRSTQVVGNSNGLAVFGFEQPPKVTRMANTAKYVFIVLMVARDHSFRFHHPVLTAKVTRYVSLPRFLYR